MERTKVAILGAGFIGHIPGWMNPTWKCYLPNRMTQEEQTIDTMQTFLTIYSKGKLLYISPLVETSDVQKVFSQRYYVNYRYFIGRDTILQHYYGFSYHEGREPNNIIPMFHLPLITDVCVKKNMRTYLVKRKLGFNFREPFENRLADYSHEIDTAFLVFPIRVFQEKYLQTKELFCLDEVSARVSLE